MLLIIVRIYMCMLCVHTFTAVDLAMEASGASGREKLRPKFSKIIFLSVAVMHEL